MKKENNIIQPIPGCNGSLIPLPDHLFTSQREVSARLDMLDSADCFAALLWRRLRDCAAEGCQSRYAELLSALHNLAGRQNSVNTDEGRSVRSLRSLQSQLMLLLAGEPSAGDLFGGIITPSSEDIYGVDAAVEYISYASSILVSADDISSTDLNTFFENAIGWVPRSGYAGEGAVRQCLLCSALSLLCTLLEWRSCEDWFYRTSADSGVSIRRILMMSARLRTPGGRSLPWNQPGWASGGTAAIAYFLSRSGDSSVVSQLCSQCDDNDAAWTLLFLLCAPSCRWELILAEPAEKSSTGWLSDDLGGVCASDNGELLLAQRWALPSAGEEHQLNPNAVDLMVGGVPITAAAGGMASIILVDGVERIVPRGRPVPAHSLSQNSEQLSIGSDVTDHYRPLFADAWRIRRRSRLVEEGFFLVEDLVEFAGEHEITARWIFGGSVIVVEGGVDVISDDGAGLQLRILQPGDTSSSVEISEKKIGEGAVCVDFALNSRQARWLWVGWPLLPGGASLRSAVWCSDGAALGLDDGRNIHIGHTCFLPSPPR